MSSVVIPKEQQSAYQRWEMASFEDVRPDARPAETETVSLPTVDEIAKIREQARLEGYAAGREEGHAAGWSESRIEIAQEISRLQQIAGTFSAAVAQADESIAEEVLNLSLDLAHAMLKTSLAVRPELVFPIVREAIRYLPAVQQPALLYLHPDDALLIKNHMGEELAQSGWRQAEDATLERGGCRVETASNQIDASPSTRWQRLAAALGKESDWLAP